MELGSAEVNRRLRNFMIKSGIAVAVIIVAFVVLLTNDVLWAAFVVVVGGMLAVLLYAKVFNRRLRRDALLSRREAAPARTARRGRKR
ncbi:hypothetical protein ACIA5G_18945 [Amycolatopsis sp. NPDC051758]|uniref:hypothetical protein n=1 Tax=Amycolatopsis sp. NPDC051758 TaxID=3363935 RepID=UPI0037A3B4D0